jgi:hypothetical protein
MEWLIRNSEENFALTNLTLTEKDLPSGFPGYFSFQQQPLTGGKQEGSELLVIQVGDTRVRVSPTRGMGIIDAQYAGMRFGWDSPVKEIVNPAFINLEAFNGTGWLEGFNEMVTRCGYQWAGHSGVDQGEVLTLHGRIQNTPASIVKLHVEDAPPYRVTLSGRVDERCFKRTDFEVWMHLHITPGSNSIELVDELTNCSDYSSEYQVIYHNNFGTPLLEKGAAVIVAHEELSPFNREAVAGLSSWSDMPAPTFDFGEQVFNIRPLPDIAGWGWVMLHSATKDKAIKVGFDTETLPVMTLWKNTDTLKEGYVVGLEPGTSFAYNRSLQRDLGLVPSIAAGETKRFTLRFEMLVDSESVARAISEIEALQGIKVPTLLQDPIINLG